METKEPKAFQVRIPADVNARLDALSKSSRMSKNKLVEAGVRHVVDGESVVLSAELGATDAREELVLAALSGEIGALKGTAQHYGNLGLHNLSALLYGLSAEVAAARDPKLASKELVRTATRLPRQKREIALGLLRAALRHNPENEVAKNHLGQMAYFASDYREAVKQLASVRERDLAVERGGQAETDGAFELSDDRVRVHDTPAIDRAPHAVHARRAALERDLDDVRDVAREREVHSDATRAARGERRFRRGCPWLRAARLLLQLGFDVSAITASRVSRSCASEQGLTR